MNSKGKAGFIVLLSVSIVAAMVACIGLDLRFPELSLDPSWEQALVEATDQGRIFGRDLIFTYGPLHQIATQQVSFNLFPLIVGRVLIGQSWFSASLLLGMKRGPRAAIAYAIMLAILNSRVIWIQGRADVLLIFLAVTGIFLSLTCPSPNRLELVLLASMTSGIALTTLVKLSMLPVASASIACITIIPFLHGLYLRKKKAVLGSFVLVATPLAALVLAWLAVRAGSIHDGLNYFFGPNLDMISGYTEAMSLGPSGTRDQMQILLYFFSFTALLVYTWKFIVRISAEGLPCKSVLRICAEAVPISALLVIGWVVAKASFVRHDVHVLTAGFSILSWSFLAALIGLHHDHSPKKALKPLTPCLISLTGGLFLLQDLGWGPDDLQFEYIPKIPATIENLFTSSGRSDLVRLRKTRWAELKPQADDYLLPSNASNLSADTLPWEIADLISQGLIYQPRPVPQSYATYTPQLQRLNAQHFERGNPSAPDIVKLNLVDIDGRVSGGLDGNALKQILANYKYSHRSSHGSLIFLKCPAKSSFYCGRRPSYSFKTSGTMWWNKSPDQQQWESSLIPIKGMDNLAWLTLDLRPTLSRRIANLAWKPHEVWMEYNDASGKPVRKARIIPAAADSLLIYPANNNALALLLGDRKSGRGDGSTAEVTSLRLRVKGPAKPFESSSYTLLSEIR